jgi:hypothetical protein
VNDDGSQSVPVKQHSGVPAGQQKVDRSLPLQVTCGASQKHSPPEHDCPGGQQVLPQVVLPVGHSQAQVVGFSVCPAGQVALTHRPLQNTCPGAHVGPQVPVDVLHVSPAAQQVWTT